ncbi:MAG: hypothetical protein JWP03_1999 [Phycisphaerales bacterium]|nr:hypothetical protein [Phycisphaerales bacterium]
MKSKILKVALLGIGLAAACWTGTVRAEDPAPTPPAKPQQDPPATPRVRPAPADFLKTMKAQFDGIGLSDDQQKKIDGFFEVATRELKDLEGRDDARQQMGDVFRKLNEDVQSVLTDAQKQALRQKFQQQIFDRLKETFAKPELNLTDEQQKKITDVMDEAKKKLADLTAGNDPQQDRQAMFQLMRDTREKLNAVLTPEQQKQIPQFGGGRRGQGGQPNTPPQ